MHTKITSSVFPFSNRQCVLIKFGIYWNAKFEIILAIRNSICVETTLESSYHAYFGLILLYKIGLLCTKYSFLRQPSIHLMDGTLLLHSI